MKIFDLKVAVKDVYGKNHWRTVGAIFAADGGLLVKQDGKPVGFAIDWPPGSGIVVPRPKKDSQKTPEDDDKKNIDNEESTY